MSAGDPVRELPTQLGSYLGDVVPFAAPLAFSLAFVVTAYLIAAAFIRRAGRWT